MIRFNKHYFGLAIIYFLLEVMIALYVHDDFVRPYIGDALVVILIYCFIKAFFRLPVLTAAVFVLVFSFTIELLQYLNMVEMLGLQKSKVPRIVIGTSFSWLDLIMYAVGFTVILIIEKYWFRRPLRASPERNLPSNNKLVTSTERDPH